MITTNNYFSQISSIGPSNLPALLLKSHELIRKVTQDGASWETYQNNESIKRMIDLYFSKLIEYINQNKIPDSSKSIQKKNQQERKKIIKKFPSPLKIKKQKPIKIDSSQRVEMLDLEIKFIKRFLLLNGKIKTSEQILGFLNSLQKSILERRIRKTSSYAEEIKLIQEKLVQTYNQMGKTIQIHLKPETLEKMAALVKSEKIMPSILFIKRYVNIQGKSNMHDKAKKLFDDMQKAVKVGILKKSDKYADKVNLIHKSLHNLLFQPSKYDTLTINEHELNGLIGILNSCSCSPLDGIEQVQFAKKSGIMNSLDFAKMKFTSIGFKEKWLDFIGDPAKGFTAMVFGKPKMGKSYFCIDFAGYLARNHGRVLYVAKEERLDATLQKKLNDTNVKHPNLFVSDYLPENLTIYDFVFLDSVNKMELLPIDLDTLKVKFPSVSFIYVFQTTKEGNFRGSNHFQHDVDVVIEIPEKGLAIQNGRFNQGGEMKIF